MLKHDLSDLSVNVGGNLIKLSEKVRDLGVILDQTLSFDDHISAICQSAHFHIGNITPVLKQLHWLKVRERIRYTVLILADKSFYETAPQYLSALITRKDYVKIQDPALIII